MAATFYNHNQILGIQLIPMDALMWKVGDFFLPYGRVFHLRTIQQKKRLTIAYLDGGTYKSISNDKPISVDPDNGVVCDAIIRQEPVQLMLDVEDISFDSSPNIQRSGILYDNKLRYSLAKMTASEFSEVERQLVMLQSGKAFHLLFQLYSCESARSIVLCPTMQSFSANVSNKVKSTDISITIKNLTSCQFLI